VGCTHRRPCFVGGPAYLPCHGRSGNHIHRDRDTDQYGCCIRILHTDPDTNEYGCAIFDPDSGDVLGRRPGKTLGTIIITEVHDRFSVAQTTAGKAEDFQTGLKLKKRQ